jgi:hypothetical protein
MSCARPKEAPEKLQSAIAFAMSDWSALFTNGFEDWAGVVASSQTLGGCHLRSVERLAQRPSLRKLRLSAGTQLRPGTRRVAPFCLSWHPQLDVSLQWNSISTRKDGAPHLSILVLTASPQCGLDCADNGLFADRLAQESHRTRLCRLSLLIVTRVRGDEMMGIW